MEEHNHVLERRDSPTYFSNEDDAIAFLDRQIKSNKQVESSRLTVDEYESLYSLLYTAQSPVLERKIRDRAVGDRQRALAGLWQVLADKCGHDESWRQSAALLMEHEEWIYSSAQPVLLDSPELITTTMNILSDPHVDWEFRTLVMHDIAQDACEYSYDVQDSVRALTQATRGEEDYVRLATMFDNLRYLNKLLESEEAFAMGVGFTNILPTSLEEAYKDANLPYLLRIRLQALTTKQADPFMVVDINKFIMGAPRTEEMIDPDHKYPFRITKTQYAYKSTSGELCVGELGDDERLTDFLDILQLECDAYATHEKLQGAHDQAIQEIARSHSLYPEDVGHAVDGSPYVGIPDLPSPQHGVSEVVLRQEYGRMVSDQRKQDRIVQDDLHRRFLAIRKKWGVTSMDNIRDFVTSNTKPLTTDMLVLSPEQVSPEAQEAFLSEYSVLASHWVREHVKRDFGIQMHLLTLPQQNRFLQFLMETREVDIEPIQQFIHQYGEDGAKIFLAAEHGGVGIVQQLLERSSVDDAAMENVVRAYGLYADAVSDIESYLHEVFPTVGLGDSAVAHVRTQIAQRGLDLLKGYLQGAADSSTLLAQIGTVTSETIVFASAFRAFRQHFPDMRIEDVQAMKVEVLDGHVIKQSDREFMSDMYDANYAHESLAFRAALRQGLHEKFAHARFYIMRYKEKIVAFDAFTSNEDGTTYFGAFNVAPHLQGNLLGGALLNESLDVEARRGVVIADCIPDADIVETYLNKFGFVGIGMSTVGGKELLRIKLDRAAPSEISTLALPDVRAGTCGEQSYVHRTPIEQAFCFQPRTQSDVITHIFHDGEYRYVVYAPHSSIATPENRERFKAA